MIVQLCTYGLARAAGAPSIDFHIYDQKVVRVVGGSGIHDMEKS